jgi:hypothetical protein
MITSSSNSNPGVPYGSLIPISMGLENVRAVFKMTFTDA